MISKQTQYIFWWVGGLFALFALILDGLFCYFYIDTQDFIKNSIKTKGTVIGHNISYSKKNNKMYSPVVEFTDRNGKSITIGSRTYSSIPVYEVGEKVDVVYSKDNPQEGEIDSFFELWGAASITGVLGGIFSFISLGFLYSAYSNVKEREYIKNHGIKIKATIEGIEQNRHVKINGRHPYRIRASYYDEKTKEKHIFLSDEYRKDISFYIDGKDVVEVWVLPNNYKKYVVDTSFISSK
ncbi:MAG: DUF3592 domain-containing protein [Flammeovirgaceae bacterium]|nr:DUF3592 domain-containing protein [Flammeovirgaceae bacterium]MDW8288290.1 DUF3592 domain-containing protein [Flammeovirgaceae bacterium]